MKPILTILCLAALLCGCVIGTKFTFSQASRVKVGMTDDEVIQIMGRPYLFNSYSNRVEWIYAWGSMTGQAGSVVFNFDTNGIVTSTPHIPKTLIETNPPPAIHSPRGK